VNIHYKSNPDLPISVSIVDPDNPESNTFPKYVSLGPKPDVTV
jgi:hypothetical protein